MGFTTQRMVSACVSVCILVFTVMAQSSSSGSSDKASSSSSFTCHQVRELFEGGIGIPIALHSQPALESESSVCRRGGKSGGHGEEYSCCSQDTEQGFAEEVDKRLKANVRHKNSALKKRLKNVVHHYQERLRKLSEEAENRTAERLSRLHRIPWGEHRSAVAHLYRSLQGLGVPASSAGLAGSSSSNPLVGGSGVVRSQAAGLDSLLEDVVMDFFQQLFPSVFGYVLSGGERGEGHQQQRSLSPEYTACLKRYAEQIQPFGNVPERLVTPLKHSLRHARAFQQSLNTLVEAMALTEAASMESSCRHALLRLQVCPTCRGVGFEQLPSGGMGIGIKSCRGLCLNVMRGCLAKMSEVSSSWDDLVIAFENLQVGMLGRHDLQKTLLYLDLNISDAIMMAMDDSVRIYREVEVKCQDARLASASPVAESGVDASPPLSAKDSEVLEQRSVQVMREFRQEMRALVKVLEDSKGRFNRLPDWLCEDERLYGQDMMSDTCWNGTGVGRYMEQVPEANFLSQVQRNKEVRLNLMDADFRHFLQVKESLTHMRRDLSELLNSEIMQGDGPRGQGAGGRGGPTAYHRSSVDRVEGSGGGRMHHKDVIVDDEDLVAYGSGSGSGSGDDSDDDFDDKGKASEPPITRRPTPKTPSSGTTLTTSAAFIFTSLALALLQPLLLRLH